MTRKQGKRSEYSELYLNDLNLKYKVSNNMIKILHKDLSYKINGLCFALHRNLGRFCREKQYCDEFELLLKKEGIKYLREHEIKKFNFDSPRGNRVDFLIDNKIIIDFKAKNFITKEDYNQMQRYLKGANLDLGMIINFRSSHLKPKRILNSECDPNLRMHPNDMKNKFGSFGYNSDHSDRQKGFTLIETIIYLALIGGIVGSFVSFSLSISASRNKTYVAQEVNANGRQALEIITQKIRSAQNINVGASTFDSDPGVLSLAMDDSAKNPTIISLDQDDGTLQITEGLGSAVSLTSSRVRVDNLVFYHLAPYNKRKNVKIDLGIEFNSSGNADFSYEQDFQTAVSVRQ